MYGLNIHLQSFKLSKDIIQENDKVRISITTLPNQQKEAFVINYKMKDHVHHFFTVDITEETQKILFVFRKKSFLQSDPIIASTTISSENIPNMNNKSNQEIKTVSIYEPVKNGNKTRQILGEMKIQFSATTSFPTFPTFPTFPSSEQNSKSSFDINKMNKSNEYSSQNNENQQTSNSLVLITDIYN